MSTDEIEIFDTIGDANTKAWQWVYLVEHSPLWNITPSFLTKAQWQRYVDAHNSNTTSNRIVDYRKVKVTKIIRVS